MEGGDNGLDLEGFTGVPELEFETDVFVFPSNTSINTTDPSAEQEAVKNQEDIPVEEEVKNVFVADDDTFDFLEWLDDNKHL